ncbi:MAG: methionyl-tRNA formyltransferase [Verrucomicrobiota bacterium]
MKIVFIGTGEIGVPALTALAESPKCGVVACVTQPDRPAGRGQNLRASPVKQAAMRQHLSLFQPDDINTPTSLGQLRYHEPDLLVVAAYGQILKPELLELPRLGCLNIHASLLPRHRGAAPIQSAMLAGDRETGVTIMWMEEGLDTGDILLKEKTLIRSKDTAGSLHDRLAELGAKAMMRALDLLLAGELPREPQDDSQSSYARKLRKPDGEIQWSQGEKQIDLHIRAMHPWPGAFTTLEDGEGRKRTLKVHSVIRTRQCSGPPGQILRIDSHGILVSAGSGGLLLREVQAEGRRQMSAADFANGAGLEPGMFLGR